jgi:hypothetical protein
MCCVTHHPGAGVSFLLYVCRWKHVECDPSGRLVQTLNLTSDNFEVMLSGVLPPASVLQGLTGLHNIDIRCAYMLSVCSYIL